MVSTLKDKKQKKNEDEKKNKEKGNDWVGFIVSFLKSLTFYLIYASIGTGLLFGIHNLNDEIHLPTNINKMPYNPTKNNNIFETFPYVPYNGSSSKITSVLFPFLSWMDSNTTTGQIFSRTIASSMATSRSFIKGLFTIGCPGYKSTDKKSGYSYVCSDTSTFIQNLIIVFGPLLLMFLSVIPILPIYTAYESFKTFLFTPSGIIMKLLLLIPIYFIIFFMSSYSLIYPLIFTLYSSYMMVKKHKLRDYLKCYKMLFYTYFVLSIISPVFNNLKPLYSIIALCVLSIPYLLYIYRYVFG